MRPRQFFFGLAILILALFSATLRLQASRGEALQSGEDSTPAQSAPSHVEITVPAKPPPRPRPAVSKPANRLQARFHELLDKTWEKLPLVESLKNATPDEIHFAPPGLLDVAEDLTRVSKIMRENPTLVASGVEFYRSCALREATYDSVRGFCLRQLKKWAPTTVRDGDYPADIRRIADSSPPE